MAADANTLHEQVKMRDKLLTRFAERSLSAFVQQAWPILEPDTPFLSNWQIELIAEYLEAVTAGEITRLVINIPPRYGKSLLGNGCGRHTLDGCSPAIANDSRRSTHSTAACCCSRRTTVNGGQSIPSHAICPPIERSIPC